MILLNQRRIMKKRSAYCGGKDRGKKVKKTSEMKMDIYDIKDWTGQLVHCRSAPQPRETRSNGELCYMRACHPTESKTKTNEIKSSHRCSIGVNLEFRIGSMWRHGVCILSTFDESKDVSHFDFKDVTIRDKVNR